MFFLGLTLFFIKYEDVQYDIYFTIFIIYDNIKSFSLINNDKQIILVFWNLIKLNKKSLIEK